MTAFIVFSFTFIFLSFFFFVLFARRPPENSSIAHACQHREKPAGHVSIRAPRLSQAGRQRRSRPGVPALHPGFRLPPSALGRDGRTAPSNRIHLAAIGRGFGWPMFLRDDVRYVPVCDVR